VALLEGWLGPPALFARSNRKVALTSTGAALLQEWAPALDRIAAATRRHRSRRGEAPAAVLHVNALATFSLRWLVPRLTQFREQHPAVEVRLTTSNDPVDEVLEPHDVIIRGGPDLFDRFDTRRFLIDRRSPVCSPALLARWPLREPADLARHSLLHVASMPRLWRDWLDAAGVRDLEPAASLTLDHFFLTVQAALDGLGVAMGPTALVADDLAAGRLVAPFPEVSLPARGYCTYVPQGRGGDPAIGVFCDWLQQAGGGP
jgi:LysR family glycine cleavage system transcriptional activator